MTNKEYITNVLAKFNVSSTDVDIVLLDNGIGSDDDADLVVCKTAIHKNLSTWLPVHSSLSEGGVSESWNYEAIKLYYSALCEELGLENFIENSQNSVRDKSNIW